MQLNPKKQASFYTIISKFFSYYSREYSIDSNLLLIPPIKTELSMKKVIFGLMVATFLLQWLVPLQMIFQQEVILEEGIAYKFKTRPIDPNDPFRGKYVVLNYESDIINLDNAQDWVVGEKVFVSIEENAKGFAEIYGIGKVPPIEGKNYLQAEIGSIFGENPMQARINYPFTRYYMEETKAPKAEALFREIQEDTTQIIYSIVVINNGKAALEEVMLNDISLKEAVN